MSEFIDLFLEKEQWFVAAKQLYNLEFTRTAPADFYYDLFPPGSFQEEQGKDYIANGKGNGFLVYKFSEEKKRTRMIFDNHFDIYNLFRNEDVALSPIAYFGKNRTLANARELFAFVFDLDEVGSDNLMYLFSYIVKRKSVPAPTYVVNSGNGVHLYYLFETPIPLYPNIQVELKKLKYALTRIIWNGDTSGLENRQYQGINQAFRVVGSGTKKGHTTTAWKYGKGEKVTLAHLSSFVEPENRILDTFYHSKITLEEAKKRYPDWYHQRIELKRKRKNWTCKRDLYDWWKRQILKVQYHHRYFFLMSLTLYAVKCEISFEELKKDAYDFQGVLNDLMPGDPFTKHDIDSALEMYQESYRSFPRDEIAKLTAIDIPKNKRNGRKQEQHLKIARGIKKIKLEIGEDVQGGKANYKQAVFTFLDTYPNSKEKEFVELTGMSRRVFYKYKKEWLIKNGQKLSL